MAYLFDLMVTVSNAGGAIYRLKELLKLAGWVHQASSDGTNVSNTPGNVNDQVGSAAEMATNNAWWVGKQPAMTGDHGPGGRQVIFRRGTSDANWLIGYVPLTSGGVAQTPTGAGTTTAIPTFTTVHAVIGTLPDTTVAYFNAASGKRWQFCADDTDPFGFYMVNWTTGGVGAGGIVGQGVLLFDPLEVGSFNVLDQDPYVIYAQTSAVGSDPLEDANLCSAPNTPNTTFGLTASSYYRKGLSGESYLPHSALGYYLSQGGNQGWSPNCFGFDPYEPRREKALPLWWARRSGAGVYGSQVKGSSSLMRWKSGGWPTGLLLGRTVDGDRVVVADITLPWDPATAPSWT